MKSWKAVEALVSGLKDPIPNLLDKYGGAATLKPLVIDFCTRLQASPSTRRCYGDLPVKIVIEHSFALFALALGKPVDGYDFMAMKDVFHDNSLTQHAYEEMVLMMRHVLLNAGYLSRDVSIAVNVLDIYCEAVFGIKALRTVHSPFAGVDRRKVARGTTTLQAS